MIKELRFKWIRLLSKLFPKKRIDYIPYLTTGAKISKPDKRDYVVGSLSVQIEGEVDLRPFIKEKKNQGIFNSCVAHSICSCIELQLNMKDPKRFMPLSERYLWRNARLKSWGRLKNQGVYTRDGLKEALNKGISPEYLCAYKVSVMDDEPSKSADYIAKIYKKWIKSYYTVWSDIEIRRQLSMGNPVIISVPIYPYWNDLYSQFYKGVLRPPISFENSIGNHSVLVVGYNKDFMYILNSWGTSWGDKGIGYLPWGYPINERRCIEVV